MNLPESEKFFLECFDKVINTDGCVIAHPEEIRTFGKIFRLEGQIDLLQKLYVVRPITEIRTLIDEKKKQLEEICK